MLKYSREQSGALLLLLGITEFFIFLNIAAFVDKGYSISGNTISHLGIDSTGYIFNISIIFLGIFEIASSIFLYRYSKIFTLLLILGGIGAAGVGIFNENYGGIHLSFAILAFLSPAILSYFALNRYKNILSAGWAVLGSIAIIALVLFGSGIYLGLGRGGMERMILIPDLIFAFQFGTFIYIKTEPKSLPAGGKPVSDSGTKEKTFN